MKTAVLTLLTLGTLSVLSPGFAGPKPDADACCAGSASHANNAACIDYGSLNLTGDQKSKIEAWQAECTRAGYTKESRPTFLKQAKGILSAEQFAKRKEKCKT